MKQDNIGFFVGIIVVCGFYIFCIVTFLGVTKVAKEVKGYDFKKVEQAFQFGGQR